MVASADERRAKAIEAVAKAGRASTYELAWLEARKAAQARSKGPRAGMTWEQVREINARRRLREYAESEALGERMARDRDA